MTVGIPYPVCIIGILQSSGTVHFAIEWTVELKNYIQAILCIEREQIQRTINILFNSNMCFYILIK